MVRRRVEVPSNQPELDLWGLPEVKADQRVVRLQRTPIQPSFNFDEESNDEQVRGWHRITGNFTHPAGTKN